MTVMVTGCAGFIGSEVCHTLLDQGESIVGIDNLNEAYDVRLKLWRLSRLGARDHFSFHERDISDYDSLKSLFLLGEKSSRPPFTSVINLAARAEVRSSLLDPWSYYKDNTIGTLNILELCKDFDVHKMVLSSTSSAYGEGIQRPFTEDSNTSKPLSPYAASKMAAEELAYTYHYLYGIDSTIFRYFTVYGPAGRPDMSIFIFIRSIVEELPLTVFGDGSQERDFTFVTDIAKGTAAATASTGYEIINLGNDNPTVLSDVIEMIENMTEKEARIEYKPTHKADVKATWANISRAKALLDWTPQVSLEEGLQKTVDWYMENRAWAKSLNAE